MFTIWDLDKLIFVNKNWPNDPMINCKSFFSLIDFIETDANFKKELEEFEKTLKTMKLWSCKIRI
jgi:hypothetical protein